MNNRVIVIGGGPAGMMAGIAAAERGLEVLLLEGNEKLGKKLYITGKGRCNLTNDCPQEDFLRNVPRGAAFLRSSLAALDSRALMRFFEESGVPLIVERGRRVFPASQKASDITRALQRRMERAGVRTRVGAKVLGLVTEGGVCGVRVEGETLECGSVIVATGGISYPATGSTGDGYRFAEEAGHAILPPKPSLVPLETVAAWPAQLQGLALKNVTLRGKVGKKIVFDEMGELLFTHFGISGPLALSLSAHLPEDPAQMRVWLDMKPALDAEQASARVLREIEAAQRRQIVTVLHTLMPQNMAPIFLRELGIDPATPAHQITKAQRGAIAEGLKNLPLAIRGTRSPEEAVITRGGVDVRQVHPKTMESKLVPGLYFAGEILNIDAYTGGFNLQIAFCTGFAAGRYVGEDAQ